MDKSVYISAPVQLDWGTVLKYVAHIDNTFNVRVWDRESKYNSNYLKESDIFLLLTIDNSWHVASKYLPCGCKRELDEAITLNKAIYLGYQTEAGDVAIYKTHISNGIISGILGPGNSSFKIKEDKTECAEVNFEDSSKIDIALEEIYHSFADKRLLLI